MNFFSRARAYGVEKEASSTLDPQNGAHDAGAVAVQLGEAQSRVAALEQRAADYTGRAQSLNDRALRMKRTVRNLEKQLARP